MGMLVEGKWTDRWYDTKATKGRFVRSKSTFRSWVSADGSTEYPARANRYHLYVAMACPWAHRTLIFRKLKKLEDVISVSVVAPEWGEEGWQFNPELGGTVDHLHGTRNFHELYTIAEPSFTGRVTVPVLWDKQTNTVVNNESAEIIRMLNSEFNEFGDDSLDLYPQDLRDDIDALNSVIYDTVNNGVYRAGFASTQEAYAEAVTELFDTLESLESRLSQQRYLFGDRITEADWRLFTTLLRFDPVYLTHFKCNIKRLVDFPNLWGYTRELYQVPGVAETVSMDEIKRHYYGSHKLLNPHGIVPLGPAVDFTEPHGRG